MIRTEKCLLSNLMVEDEDYLIRIVFTFLNNVL